MKLAAIIPIQLVVEENGIPTGETCDVELPRNEYVWCRRAIRKLGLPPFEAGGFNAIIRGGLELTRARRATTKVGGAR